MNDALAYAQQHADTFVDQLTDWLRIPSISTDADYNDDTRRAADWLAADLRRIGVERVEVMETGGHPIVYAEHRAGDDRPTVLVYGHYDVQPPDPLDLWDSPPFEPVIKDGHIVARGSADDKGQAFMHVKSLEAYLQSGADLPVNLKMMIEGEEESGSVHLAPFIEDNKDLLAADVVLVSDTSLFAPGVPSIAYGLRGLAYVEVELTGPGKDLHSGVYGGGVENPVNALAKMIADLHDADHRVTVEGFYDNVRDLSGRRARGVPRAARSTWRRGWPRPASRPPRPRSGYTALEGTSGRPTLDVNGIWGGYTGKGAKTVLPSKATAKISCRLVPDQGPERDHQKAPPPLRGARPRHDDARLPRPPRRARGASSTSRPRRCRRRRRRSRASSARPRTSRARAARSPSWPTSRSSSASTPS